MSLKLGLSLLGKHMYYMRMIRGVRWAWNVACAKEMRNAHKIKVEKHESKKPFGKPLRMLGG
jgi:hypothetical protein